MKRIKPYKGSVRVGLLAGAVVVAGVLGCDSTPSPPSDVPPSTEKPGSPKKGIKAFQRGTKGEPTQEAPKPKH